MEKNPKKCMRSTSHFFVIADRLIRVIEVAEQTVFSLCPKELSESYTKKNFCVFPANNGILYSIVAITCTFIVQIVEVLAIRSHVIRKSLIN